jgi:hypothetical protein
MKSTIDFRLRWFFSLERRTLFLRPSVVVAIIYGSLIALVAITKHYSLLDFVHLGTIWADHNPKGMWGYDGQFYYQIARNPLQVHG